MKDRILRIERIGGEDYEVVAYSTSACSKCDFSGRFCPAAGADGKCRGGYLRKVKDTVTVSQENAGTKENKPVAADWSGLFRRAVVFFQGFLFALVCTQDREFAAYAALVLAAVTAAKLMGRE